jgi:hypothetical protein
MLMLLCMACGGSDSEPVGGGVNDKPKAHQLQINIFMPEHPVVTRSEEPVLVNSYADENVNSLDVWVVVSGEKSTTHFPAGKVVGHLSLDIANPSSFEGGTYQMSVNEDFVNEQPKVNVYVTANVKPSNTGINLTASSSESDFQNATLSGGYFGLTPHLTTQVPLEGLPMSGVLKNQVINDASTPLLKVDDPVKVVRAVSKIRFIFSRSDTGETDQLHINKISLDAGDMIPAEEYLFLNGPYDYTDIKKRSNIKGSSYLPTEETTLAEGLESITIPASTYPARFAYDPKKNPDQLKGQVYEDLIDRGLQGVDNNNNPELVELQRYYLRESDKKLKGKIYYTIGNGGEGWPKSTEFEMVAAGDFTRNHTWIVYGYFTGKETLTISSIDVTNWDLKNTEHNVYNW